MIAKLRGKILELHTTDLILDVQGVGYQCHIPLSTYEKLVGLAEAELFIYTYVREDQIKLYGFFSLLEKNVFSILTSIGGIGPAMALSILSGISIWELLKAVKDNEIGLLVKIPGIGKNKAEKLLFELKRKVKKLEPLVQDVPPGSTKRNEAIEALLSLGFDEKSSSKTVNDLLNEDDSMEIENVIRNALKRLSL